MELKKTKEEIEFTKVILSDKEIKLLTNMKNYCANQDDCGYCYWEPYCSEYLENSLAVFLDCIINSSTE